MNNKAIILVVSKPYFATDTADHAKAQIDIIKKHSRQLNCDIIESIAVKGDIDRVNEHIIRIAANNDTTRANVLILYSIRALGRNTFHTLNCIKLLNQSGISVYTVREGEIKAPINL